MRIKRGDRGIETRRVGIVEQQPHAHAAIGGVPQLLQQKIADLVAMPDVVLGIDGALRSRRKQRPRSERIFRHGQGVNAGISGVRACALARDAAKRGRSGIGERVRRRTIAHVGQRRARCDQRTRADRQSTCDGPAHPAR